MWSVMILLFFKEINDPDKKIIENLNTKEQESMKKGFTLWNMCMVCQKKEEIKLSKMFL